MWKIFKSDSESLAETRRWRIPAGLRSWNISCFFFPRRNMFLTLCEKLHYPQLFEASRTTANTKRNNVWDSISNTSSSVPTVLTTPRKLLLRLLIIDWYVLQPRGFFYRSKCFSWSLFVSHHWPITIPERPSVWQTFISRTTCGWIRLSLSRLASSLILLNFDSGPVHLVFGLWRTASGNKQLDGSTHTSQSLPTGSCAVQRTAPEEGTLACLYCYCFQPLSL